MGDDRRAATTAEAFRAAWAARDVPSSTRLATTWVEEEPTSAEAHNALGNVQVASGALEAAEASFRRATELAPSLAKVFSNLGGVLRTRGDLAGATLALARAVALDPASFRAWSNLGNVHRQAGRLRDAREAYERAVALEGASASTHHNLGSLLAEGGLALEAIRHFEEALRIDPRGRDAPATRRALAEVLVSQGRHGEARGVLDAGLALDTGTVATIALAEALLSLAGPEDAEKAVARVVPDRAALGPFWTFQGKLRELRGDLVGAERAAVDAAEALRTGAAWCEVARLRRRRNDDAGVSEALRTARAIDPLSASPSLFEGDEQLTRGDYEGAEASFREAARLAPGLVEPDANLAKLASMRGDVAESVAALRQVIARRPTHAVLGSNLLLTLHYQPPDPERMFEEHLRWARTHLPLASPAGFAPRAGASSRKLRIGYLSADLRNHAVARFFEPLLESHDRARFTIHVYDAGANHDAYTARMRALGDAWREVHGATDAEVARRIRADGIDVLVDLGGHTAESRLSVLAERPAPVQASFLGYPDTTGMAVVDLRLTDALADPPGAADRFATEALVRLPRTAWCFRPDDRSPPVAVRDPSAPVVFGVFNNVAKVGAEARRVFAEVLRRLPTSRLLFKGRTLAEPATRRRLLAPFEAVGVADRVELRPWTSSHAAHLASYDAIDVALDTFPYAGTTSTCEALWMGVPVVTMAGATHAARVGVSLLSSVGLDELIATDAEGYVERAVALGQDRARLAHLRATLRGRVARSPLADGVSYARAVEAAYGEAYARWAEYAQATGGAADVWLPLADGAVLSVPDDTDGATRFVLEERGDWLEPELSFVRALLGEGERVLDVGADVGVYAVAMARRVGPAGHVLAFEPSPTAAAHLRRSAGRAPALRVVQAAVGAARGTSRFDPGASPALGQRVGGGGGAAGREVVEVEVVPLDDHLDELAGLSVAKVDAGGGEVDVLRGARRLLEREDPIWQWTLRPGRTVVRGLSNELGRAAPHLLLMRWVGYLGTLVPLDPDARLDARWLHVIALSPARRAALVRRGLAVEGPVAPDAPPAGDPVAAAMEARARGGSGGDPYREAMAALGAARQAYAERPSASHALLLARVAHEAGFDAEATAALDAVLDAVRAGVAPRLDGSALPPLPSQDARLPALDPATAVEVLALEARMTLGAWSGHDAADLRQQALDRLAELGALTPALGRMREVLTRFRVRRATIAG